MDPNVDQLHITPGRNTTLTLDRDEVVVIEPGVSVLRTGVEIAKRSADQTSNSNERVNVRFWSTGVWTLAPLQSDMSNVHETVTGLAAIIRAAAWTFVAATTPTGVAPLIAEVATQVQSVVTGASYSGNVPATGDFFLHKRLSAVGTLNPAALNPGFDSLVPQVPYTNVDVPMYRVGYTNATFSVDQGFCVRWKGHYTQSSFPRYMFTLYFGQYALVVGGSGRAWLWEYCYNSAGDVLRWVERGRFRFAPQGTAPGTAHSLVIFPHRSPEGINYIAFVDISKDQANQTNTSQFLGINSMVPGEHVYKVDPTVRGGDRDMSPGNVTSAGQLHLDMRSELKVDVQVSQLAWQTSGSLLDDDTIAGGGVWTGNGNTVNLTGNINYVDGVNHYINATLLDAVTGGVFQPGNPSQPFTNASVFMQTKFDFVSTDGVSTPMLWGYSLKQEPLVEIASPGAFDVDVKKVEIEFSSGDPQSESATVNTFDVPMEHQRLANRGRFSALLWTTLPNGEYVKLFQGVCRQPRSTRRGAGRTIPGILAPDFREYDLALYGMWDRLNDSEHMLHSPMPRVYLYDLINAQQPWKVTDVIVDALTMCGFAPWQINIPDLPYRIWTGSTQKTEDLSINPAASIAEFLIRIIRNYLGAYLHFEPNTGQDGQWIIVFGTQPLFNVPIGESLTFNSIYGFSSTPTPGLAPYLAAAYPANSSFIETSPEYWTEPPEYNCIWVTTGTATLTATNMMQCAAVACNPLSFNVPGMTTAPDPEHPDYLGYCKPLRISMPELNVPGGDYSQTFAACQWLCRRLFDYLCHARRMTRFTAPLAIISDSTIGAHRPLRFQDPINIDNDPGWLLKAPKAAWNFDGVQMCTYEAIKPFAGQYFLGRDMEHAFKDAHRRQIQRNSGMKSASAMFGTIAPSGHKEGGLLELPFARNGFTPIQYPDGTFIPINGWDTFTGNPG